MSRKVLNFAKLNENYKMGNAGLPSEMLADLTDAFNYYDKENNGYISIAHFRNILHNFGYHKPAGGKKEIDSDLERADMYFKQRTAVQFDFVRAVIQSKWNKSGQQEEARECFKLFDKRDKNYITAADLKQVLSNFLEFPVSEQDIQDFITECGGDKDGTGNVQFREFARLYLSA